jgi:hypothetical protein
LFAGSGGKNLPAWPQKNATFYHAFSNGHFYHNFAWPLTGLLPELSYVQIEPNLERLIILIKSCRPHERSSFALQLADALEIPGI